MGLRISDLLMTGICMELESSKTESRDYTLRDLAVLLSRDHEPLGFYALLLYKYRCAHPAGHQGHFLMNIEVCDLLVPQESMSEMKLVDY